MRMKSVTRLLTLALVFMMTLSIPALAESCALCGKETGNDAYLCAACLLGLMEEKDVSGGLEITDVLANDDGSVTILWADAAENGPYTVYYELLEKAPVPFGWTAAKAVNGSGIILTQLAPGTSYVFTVTNAAGNKAEHTYYAPKVVNGNEIGARIGVTTQKMYESRTKTPWVASEIALDNGIEHGLYLRMDYSMLKKTRYYAYCLVVEAPNGFADVVTSGNVTLTYGKSTLPAWSFIRMDDYFSYLERYYGGIPAGEYKASMYFDGKFVHSDVFNVAE